MRVFIDNFQCPKDWDSFDVCYEANETNIDEMFCGISDGWTEWTIDHNSGICVGDVVIFMCAVTSKDNMGRMRTAVKKYGSSDELDFAEKQYLKYKEYAGTLLSIGIVVEIYDKTRMSQARIEFLQGFDNPILYDDIKSFISVSKTGIMTSLSDYEYERLLECIKYNNPDIDLSLYLEKPNISDELDKIESDSNHLEGKDREAFVKHRLNQGAFRNLLLTRYKQCCLCGVRNVHLLLASHIKPWSMSAPHEKMDVDNGLLLCPNHDKLFDQGYITFDDDKRILISNLISCEDKMYMNVNEDMFINCRDESMSYIEYHRDEIFKK